MKVGAENRTKLYIAMALMVLAALSLAWTFTRSTSPASVTATAPPPKAGTAPPAGARGSSATSVANSVDPRLRLDLLKSSEDIEYLGKGRNIFRAEAEPAPEIPKAITPPITQPVVQQGPPPPPPITLKFFGFASQSGESKKVFLAQNDDVFVASEGDIVKGRYKILRINPNSIEVEDVLNNNRQSIPLTQS